MFINECYKLDLPYDRLSDDRSQLRLTVASFEVIEIPEVKRSDSAVRCTIATELNSHDLRLISLQWREEVRRNSMHKTCHVVYGQGSSDPKREVGCWHR